MRSRPIENPSQCGFFGLKRIFFIKNLNATTKMSLLEIETALNFLSVEAYWLEDTLRFEDKPNKAVKKRLREIYVEMEKLENKQWKLLEKELKMD
jgi:hypothetical protein